MHIHPVHGKVHELLQPAVRTTAVSMYMWIHCKIFYYGVAHNVLLNCWNETITWAETSHTCLCQEFHHGLQKCYNCLSSCWLYKCQHWSWSPMSSASRPFHWTIYTQCMPGTLTMLFKLHNKNLHRYPSCSLFFCICSTAHNSTAIFTKLYEITHIGPEKNWLNFGSHLHLDMGLLSWIRQHCKIWR